MQLLIISIGKPISSDYGFIISEYQKRLSRAFTIKWLILPPSHSSDPEQSRREDTALIQSKLPPGCFTVLLDERGKLMSNTELAKNFQGWISQQRPVVFIIGGAYGVSESLRGSVDVAWSVSPLVFPHELMRVILLEQLYRSHTILHSHPYHHS